MILFTLMKGDGFMNKAQAPISRVKSWLIITLIALVLGGILTIVDKTAMWFLVTIGLSAPVYLIALIVSAIKKKPVIGIAICLFISLAMWPVIAIIVTINAPAPIPTGQALREQCINYSYEEISRYPDKYKGKYATFTGKVIQVLEDDTDDVELRLELASGDVIYIFYTRKSKDEPRILEGDHITAYGTYEGLLTYTALFGQSVTVPLLNMYEYDFKN